MSHSHGGTESSIKADGDGVARITQGWASFVQKSSLRIGETCLFKFRKHGSVLRLKIFKL
ncbi:hypothetical protein ACP70R_046032 [Stipagrostis hirtigluma subsp. patula]